MIQRFARISLWLILVILPLQTLWLRAIESPHVAPKVLFGLTYWYELLFVVVGISVVVALLSGRLRLRFTRLDYVVLSLSVLALVTVAWSGRGLSSHVIGLRFSMLPLAVYWLARVAAVPPLQMARWLTPVAWVVLGIAIVQLVLWQLPPLAGLLDRLHLSIVFRAEGLPQLYGSFPGPNQLGAYVALALGVLFFVAPRGRYLLLGLGFLVVTLTFSRSAALATIAAVLAGYALRERERRFSVQTMAVAVTSIAGIGAIWLLVAQLLQVPFLNALTHGASQLQHWVALQEGVSRWLSDGTIVNYLVGYGAGTSGPATIVRGPAFIPESWYLQTVYEYGLIGLGLFLALFGVAVRNAYQQKQWYVVTAVAAIMANSLFLHILSDGPATAALFGAILALSQTKSFIEVT